MKRWRWALIVFESLLFALILILPQVELPDFTSHPGRTPIVVKPSLSFAAFLYFVSVTTKAQSLPHIREARGERPQFMIHRNGHFLLSLFCILLC